MSHIEHRAAAPTSVRCYVLTISDSRTEETDTGGRAIRDLLSAKGHQVTGRQILPDDPARVRAAVQAQLANPDVQAILTTGGTGISSRDNSYEAIDSLLEKRQPRFVELGPARTDDTGLPEPHVVTIVRDFSSSTDAIDTKTSDTGRVTSGQ